MLHGRLADNNHRLRSIDAIARRPLRRNTNKADPISWRNV
ncbi:hypothetical protein BSLA_03r1349 [Burkholderia stabilis]|nr:hypothetical protein BSLA_03r1349 [Burkholderia stabilis]